VIGELSDRGVALVIPSLGIVVDAASRQTLLNTMGCVLESKAAIATERTTHGMARAKRRGVKLGRPRILDVHRGEVARLRAAGMSGREIAKELGFSPRSVFNVLRRRRSQVLEGGSSDSDGFSACLIGGYPYPLPPDPYSGTVTRSSTRILERKRGYLCYRAFAHLSARARFCIASDVRRHSDVAFKAWRDNAWSAAHAVSMPS
jgi:hypothetical protein